MMISRRALLLAAPAAVLASACRPRPYRSADFVLPERSAVGLFPAANYDVDLVDVISRGMRTLGVNVKGLRVLLKPNLVEYEAGTIINTHVNVVGAAAHAMLSAGAREVVVAEGPGHRRDLEYLLVSTGLYDHLKDLKLRFVDLNHDDVRPVALRSRYTQLQDIQLPAQLLQADLVVSMPKLKTHHWAVMTASMKNLFGVVPGAVYGWPKNILHFHGIDNSIVDLVATVRPHLAIVDGIVGMEGDGPIMGTPRSVGVIAMGTDLVAVDATCARLIGLDPARLDYLSTASAFLGNINAARIDQRAESIERYRSDFVVPQQFKGRKLASGGV
jgi:uncharacterized protein (DUF362 family)